MLDSRLAGKTCSRQFFVPRCQNIDQLKVHCLAVGFLKGFLGKNAFGLKMGLLGNIDLLKLGILR